MLVLKKFRLTAASSLIRRAAFYSTEPHSGEIETKEHDEEFAPPQSTEHKDKLIFDSILDSVLMRAESKAGKQWQRPVTSTVQALFEKPREDPLDRAYNSILDNRTRDMAQLTPGLETKADRLLTQIQPILEHISALESNKEVVDFYRSVVVPHFKSGKRIEEAWPPIDKTNVGYITKHTLSVLIDDFKDPTGALNIFNCVKSQPIDYFTAAGSAGVYNQVIALRWQYYRDIQSVVALMNEMFINAVQGNNETVDLLGVITRQAIESSQGIPMADGMPLWTSRDDKLVKTLNSYRVRVMSALAGRRDFSLTNLQL